MAEQRLDLRPRAGADLADHRAALPTRICFCDSVSTRTIGAHDAVLELLDLDRDRVRHLLPRQRERLLADELGDLHLERQVGALLARDSRRALRQQLDELRRGARRMPSPVFALTGWSAWKSPSVRPSSSASRCARA